VSVLSTLLVVGLAVAGYKFGKWVKRRWKSRSKDCWRVWKYYKPGWWRGWRLRLVDVRRAEETEQNPLLGEA